MGKRFGQFGGVCICGALDLSGGLVQVPGKRTSVGRQISGSGSQATQAQKTASFSDSYSHG